MYGAGAAGGQGLGHAADLGAILDPGGTGLGPGPEDPKAVPETVGVPEARLEEAVAEAGARVAVEAAARVEASLRIGAEAAHGAVSLSEVGPNPEGVAAQSHEAGVGQSIAAIRNQKNAAEADSGVRLGSAAGASTVAVPSQKSVAEAGIEVGQSLRSAAKASSGADPSPRSAAGASAVGQSQRSAATVSTVAGHIPRRRAGASLTVVAAGAEGKVSSEIGATAPR